MLNNIGATIQGFPNGVSLQGGQLEQNAQKLHKNYKIKILGNSVEGGMEGPSQFLG